MKAIEKKDIKEQNEFSKYDERFTKVFSNDEKHIYVFRRERTDKPIVNYEVVKGVKYKNPDGNIVYIYPPSKEFGVYGWYVMGSNKDYAYKRISFHLNNLDEDVCKEFQNTVKVLS